MNLHTLPSDGTQIPRILIIEDERSNLNILHSLLRDDYQTMVATNGEQALKAIHRNKVDLILLDINMPDMDGFEVCRHLKNESSTKNIPIIFITALTDGQNEEYGLDLGAVDYITKPFNPSVTKARVRTHLRLKMQADLLEQYAFRDGLTELANRRAFDERISKEWFRCMRANSPLSIMYIDVDHFKLYNDHYGHGAGDLCLMSIGKCFSASITRSSDLVARYGGEEFAAILPETSAQNASILAEKIISSVEMLNLPHSTSHVTDHVTISMGVATTQPSPSKSQETFQKMADDMLYKAKATGRNRFCAMHLD